MSDCGSSTYRVGSLLDMRPRTGVLRVPTSSSLGPRPSPPPTPFSLKDKVGPQPSERRQDVTSGMTNSPSGTGTTVSKQEPWVFPSSVGFQMTPLGSGLLKKWAEHLSSVPAHQHSLTCYGNLRLMQTNVKVSDN